MSEIYKQKEYEVRRTLESADTFSSTFEDYVEETNRFIDRLLDETKEINTLRNIIKEVREYIKNSLDNTGWLEIGSNDVKNILEILDKENKENGRK